MQVENYLENSSDDPYIFCHAPQKTGGFDGIRIYKIGNEIAFRIQKENRTHPYGTAYPLPIEEMFHDFIGDKDVDQLKAGKKVIDAVVKEIRGFFDKSIEAESSLREKDVENQKNSLGNVAIRNTGTDYSAMIYTKGN